jgi:hypothetical protein
VRADRGWPGEESLGKQASIALRTIRPAAAIGIERRQIASEFLDEVRRHDRALVELHHRIDTAVKTAGTTVTDVQGVGPNADRSQ